MALRGQCERRLDKRGSNWRFQWGRRLGTGFWEDISDIVASSDVVDRGQSTGAWICVLIYSSIDQKSRIIPEAEGLNDPVWRGLVERWQVVAHRNPARPFSDPGRPETVPDGY